MYHILIEAGENRLKCEEKKIIEITLPDIGTDAHRTERLPDVALHHLVDALRWISKHVLKISDSATGTDYRAAVDTPSARAGGPVGPPARDASLSRVNTGTDYSKH